MSGTTSTGVSFTLTVTKPAPLVVGQQTISGNINIITIGNPGPENINTSYNGLGYTSYIPPSISSLQFNNAGPPPVFVAATTAHGGATLATTGTNPPRATLTIGLYNFDAGATKLFQIQDTAAPGLQSGQVLQSAQVSYPVLTSGAVGASVVLVRPTLPTNVWLCWRANSNPIAVTDPDVVAATINTTALTFSASMNIDAGAQTMYVSSDGVTWIPASGSPWTPTSAAGFTINAISNQTANAPFAVSGTISAYTTAPTLQYRNDSGTWVALPGTPTVTATSFSFTNPGLAAGTHTVGVRDANNNAVSVTSGTFTVSAPVTPTVSVSAPSQPSASTAFTLNGTLTGYTSAPALTYLDDSGAATALPAGASVTTTSFSFSHPGLAAGNHTTVISDGTYSGSVSYSVAAAPGGPSPNNSTLTSTTGSLTDNASNRYTLTSGNQVAINGLVGTAASATGLSAVSNISNTLSGSTYTYNDTVLNNGTVPIGTYWFAWQPGQNYLPSLPTPISPSGWTATVTGAAGGYGIEWVTATPLQPGQSVQFGFSTPDTPTTLFSAAASFPSVIVATATIEGVATSVGNTISVPASIPQQTAGQTFYVQAAFSYVPVKGANLQYSANSSGVVFGPFSGNTAITWDSTGQIATIPISSGTQSIHYFQVEDTGNTPTTLSAELTYQVGTSGGGGTYTAAPPSGGTAASALVVSSNSQPQTVIPATANVIEIAWVNGAMWYENSSNLWFSETSPAGPWLPTGGTLTSPLAGAASISVNAIASGLQPNASFTVTGTLSNYTTVPALTYSDDSGVATALPSSAQVTLTGYTFTHPGMGSGTHTLTISDGTAKTTVIYSVAASSWISLPATSSLTDLISGLLPGTSYDIEVYAQNSVGEGPTSAILTIVTSQPAVTNAGAPTSLLSAGATSSSVNLQWVAPASGGGPFTYNTRYSPTGLNEWTAGPTVSVTNAQITGLSSGTAYDFEVQATGASGVPSAWSSLVTVTTAAGVAAVTTWQAQGASSTIALTNSNLTAAAGGSSTVGSQRQAVLSNETMAAGKASFEVTLSSITDSCAIGLVNNTFSPSSTQLGNDGNSVGYYPANVPATVATSSVLGLPLWGVGVDLVYPGSGSAADPTWIWFCQNFCTPRTCLMYPGAFDTQGNITYYTQSYINGWKADAYWNGTTAAIPGTATKPCIPIYGLPLTTLDGTVTFASAAAHQNTAYFNNFIDMFNAAGFKKVAIRLCWEDNYPTTPAGQDASPGSNYPATTNGKASYCPWSFYGGGTAYANAFIAAWRAVAYDMHQHAAAVGVDLTMVWGPTIISSDSIDWRDSYPDSVLTDGHGKQVDCLGPDFYFGNFWGDTTNLRSGYNTQAPFTAGTITSTGATQAQFGADTGSKFYWSDWTDGYRAPLNPLTTPIGYQGGMSMYETMIFALQNSIPLMWCEFGGLDAFDGGTNPAGNQNNGLSYTGAANWANEPSLANYARTRIAWFQNKAQNGIANGVFLQFSFWQGQGQAMLNAFKSEFPELVANPDAGSAGGTGTITSSTPAIVPQTIRYNNAAVLTPSGNAAGADAAGATLTCCADIDQGLMWVTSPAMRAAYGPNAWNDSATATPFTETGGIPIGVTGALSICFSTGESGGVAVLNAGEGATSIPVPSTFPPWHGAAAVVTAPAQVTGLAVAQLQYSIAVPASIPAQQTGTFFSIQAAFNYVPNQANLFYTPPDVAATSTINGVTVCAFSAGLSNGGTITWDGTGTIATFKFFFNTATSWIFQIFDTTAGINAKSSTVTFVTQTGAVTGGGGTSTATATAPSTAVSLSWTAPATGTGPFTYLILQAPTGTGSYTRVGETTGTSLSLNGITPGIAYDYVVFAANGAGDGTNSSLVTYTVPGTAPVPNAPTGVSAGSPTLNSINLAWQPPTSGPTPTGYQVQYSTAANGTFTNFGTTTTTTGQTISGLTSATTYYFQVVASNSVGNSVASSVAIGTTLSPTAPPSNTITGPLATMLQATAGKGVISGQYIGNGPITPINTIDTADGQWLGLIGIDYWAPSGTGAPSVTTPNANAISYWNAGGLVMLSLSMPNPTTGGACNDLSSLDVANLLVNGSATNTALVNTLSQVAAGLAALQSAGVAVVLRPFYRANAPTYWWGTAATPLTGSAMSTTQFIALWQYVYNYLTVTKGLANILWLWSMETPFGSFPTTMSLYPGSAYVDITGMDLFTSTPITVSPTEVITVQPIPSPTSGQGFSIQGITTNVPWTNAASVMISFGATKNLISAQGAGYTVALTNSNNTATVTGLTAPAAGSYTAYMEDAGSGVTSVGQPYTVNPVQSTGGSATSVPGVPYLGWGMELCYPGEASEGSYDDATVEIGNFTAAFCKPTNMLLYTGSFANAASFNFGISSYLGTWNAYPAFNKTGLGYNLIPIAGVPLTATDGSISFASIAAGTNDAAIQSYLQTFLTAGYKTIVLRISWEDNLPTTPAGQSASQSNNGASSNINGLPWQLYAAESQQSFSTTIAGLHPGQAAFADAYIKAWRRFAWVVQQFALANGMTVWKCWGPCILQSGWFDPRLLYPDTASYQEADGWGKLVDVHGPDLYFGNSNVANSTNLKTGYQNNPVSAVFNGNYSTTGTAASVQAFFADIGSEFYAADFRSGGGATLQNAYNSSPTTKLPWSGGWGVFESMVWALQNNCSWGVPEGYATQGDNTGTSGAGKNSGTNLYGAPGFPAATDFPKIPEAAAYLRARIEWFQNESYNGIANGVVLWMSFWGSSAGIEMLQAFATAFPEVATNGGNNPLAGQVGVAFPAPN